MVPIARGFEKGHVWNLEEKVKFLERKIQNSVEECQFEGKAEDYDW